MQLRLHCFDTACIENLKIVTSKLFTLSWKMWEGQPSDSLIRMWRLISACHKERSAPTCSTASIWDVHTLSWSVPSSISMSNFGLIQMKNQFDWLKVRRKVIWKYRSSVWRISLVCRKILLMQLHQNSVPNGHGLSSLVTDRCTAGKITSSWSCSVVIRMPYLPYPQC